VSKPSWSLPRTFSPFIFPLPDLRCIDIFLLAFLRPAADKDYQAISIFAEVNPITRAKFDAIFKDAGPNTLGVGKIALLDASQSRRDLGSRFPVQTIGPRPKRAIPVPIKVLAHFEYDIW
jgi:hypothetical protein